MISVVMPVYNDQRYVGQAVRSILQQTIREVELLVVDDGSTDDTLGQVRAVSDSRVIVIEGAHQGATRCRARGIAQASFDTVALMDSDDVSHPERLERQVGFLASDDIALVGTRYGMLTPHGQVLVPRSSYQADWRTARDFTVSRKQWCDPSAMFRRGDALAVGTTEDRLDAEPTPTFLWYRLLKRGRCLVLPDILYFARVRLGSLSRGGRGKAGSRVFAGIRQLYDADTWAEVASQRRNLSSEDEAQRSITRTVELYRRAGDYRAAFSAAWQGIRRFPGSAKGYRAMMRTLLHAPGYGLGEGWISELVASAEFRELCQRSILPFVG